MSDGKLKLFIKETIARVKGDTTTVIAHKNFRTAESAYEGQLAALKGKQIKAEDAVEKAIEELKNAKYPIEQIQDGELYLQNIILKKEALEEKELELKQIKDSILYFKTELESFSIES